MDIDAIINDITEKARFIGYEIIFDQEKNTCNFDLITPEYLKPINKKRINEISKKTKRWDPKEEVWILEENTQMAEKEVEWEKHNETPERQLLWEKICKKINDPLRRKVLWERISKKLEPPKRRLVRELIYKLFSALYRIKNKEERDSDLITVAECHTQAIRFMDSIARKIDGGSNNEGVPKNKKWREAVEFYKTLPKNKNGEVIQTNRHDKEYRKGKDIKKCGALLQVKNKFGIKDRKTMIAYIEMYESEKKV